MITKHETTLELQNKLYNAQWTHELKLLTNAKLALTVDLPIGERTLLSILCYALQVFVGEDDIDDVNIDAVTTVVVK